MEPKKEYLSELLRSARSVAEEAEVFLLSSRSMPINFEANELKQVQSKESTSVALRIFREGRIGFATASGEGGLENLVDMAVETSQFGGSANFQFPSSQDYSEVRIFDSDVEEMNMETMVEIGRELIAKVRGNSFDILCDVEVTRGTSSISVINSQGGGGRYDKSFFAISLEGILVRDTDMLFVGDSESSCRPDYVGVDALADRVIRQLEMAKEKAAVSAKVLPVIFTPHGVAGALFAYNVNRIAVDQFTFTESILYVGMIIIGGMGSTLGPILGVVVFKVLGELVMTGIPWLGSIFPGMAINVAAGLSPFIFGLIIALFIIFEPRGLAHRWETFKRYYRIWPFPY